MFIDNQIEDEIAAWEAEEREALAYVNTDTEYLEALNERRAMGIPDDDELDAMVDAMERNFSETGRFELPADFDETRPGR